MKKLLLALALCLFFPTIASAQCNGVFGASTICGRDNSSGGPPKQVPFSTAFGTQYVQCTNTSADVAKLNTALALGGEVRPIGTCMVGVSAGSAVSFTASNTWLHGFGKGNTILKVQPASSYSGCVLQALSVNDIRLSDFTFDGSDAGTGLAPPNGTMICGQAITGVSYDHIEILRMYGTFGMSMQGVTNFNISNNEITLTTARNSQNQCILVTQALQNTNGHIRNNICNGSAIEYDGTGIDVMGNEVLNWKFGSGITTGANPTTNTSHNMIMGNYLHDSGPGQDTTPIFPSGIEDWGPYDTVIGNVTYRNAGNGITAGALNGTYIGNIVQDNSQGVGANAAGLLVQFAQVGQSCDHCTVSGNSVFNTNGASGPQANSIAVNALVTGAVVSGDNYAGPAPSGAYLIPNTSAQITGLFPNSVPLMGYNAAQTAQQQLIQLDSNNHVLIGGPSGAGTEAVFPQQISVFGWPENNPFPIGLGSGGSNATLAIATPSSGTGAGSGIIFTQGTSAANVFLNIGTVSAFNGGTYNSDPEYGTNDFITTTGKMHFGFASLGSVDALSLSASTLNMLSALELSWNGDTGLSRTGAAQIGVGNGTAGNTGGTLLASQFVASGNALWALDVNAFAGLKLASGSGVSWSSTTNWFGTLDTGLTRDSAGVIDVGNGSAANKSGSLNATNTTLTGTATAKRVTGNTNSVPTNNACTGFALATGSSDLAGKVTFTSATSCNINFGSAFTNAPFCTVSPGSAASTVLVSTTTTVLSVTFGTANTAMYYICAGA